VQEGDLPDLARWVHTVQRQRRQRTPQSPSGCVDGTPGFTPDDDLWTCRTHRSHQRGSADLQTGQQLACGQSAAQTQDGEQIKGHFVTLQESDKGSTTADKNYRTADSRTQSPLQNETICVTIVSASQVLGAQDERPPGMLNQDAYHRPQDR
jgi:hypothetical protein